MGITTCPIHGLSGFYEVCEHLRRDFNQGIIPEIKYLPVIGTQLCIDCYNENNVKEIPDLTIDESILLPEEEYLMLEDRIHTVYNAINRRSICSNCFKQVQVIDAKKTGKELSFEAFENTLMYKDKETIKALEQILKDNFNFKQKINHFTNTLEENWYIMSGQVSNPLSIIFYYINKEEDQNKILTLINNFFENIPQKQRKIIFYKSENWIIEKRGSATRTSKGQEKILLEVLVR